LRFFAQKIFRIDRERSLPKFTGQKLSRWFEERSPIRKAAGQCENTDQGRRVVLFNDTYTENNLPEVGRAAVEVLEAAGYCVELVTVGDSQRSAISQGMLEKAKREGTKLFHKLDARSIDTPLLVCEPSCASSLADDLPDLLDDIELGYRVASRVKMVDHFLEQELASGRCVLHWKSSAILSSKQFLVHIHCHQRTLDGGHWTHKLLARIPGATVEDTEAGCCGMAGSFGYEVEHAELSRQIAGQRLLPRLAKAGAEVQVVTNGFSCRHQIADLSERSPRHVVEVIREFIECNLQYVLKLRSYA